MSGLKSQLLDEIVTKSELANADAWLRLRGYVLQDGAFQRSLPNIGEKRMRKKKGKSKNNSKIFIFFIPNLTFKYYLKKRKRKSKR